MSMTCVVELSSNNSMRAMGRDSTQFFSYELLHYALNRSDIRSHFKVQVCGTFLPTCQVYGYSNGIVLQQCQFSGKFTGAFCKNNTFPLNWDCIKSYHILTIYTIQWLVCNLLQKNQSFQASFLRVFVISNCVCTLFKCLLHSRDLQLNGMWFCPTTEYCHGNVSDLKTHKIVQIHWSTENFSMLSGGNSVRPGTPPPRCLACMRCLGRSQWVLLSSISGGLPLPATSWWNL